MAIAQNLTTSASVWSRFAPLLFAVLQILTPLLPALGIGEQIGSQSDMVRTLITPAGWAFSIWGALYTGSLVFAVYQALPAQRDNALLGPIRLPAAGAFAGDAVWVAYSQVYGLSVVSVLIIMFTLSCLMIIYQRLTFAGRSFTRDERWCLVLPLSALASWLTAATIVNIAAALQFHGVDGGAGAEPISAAVLVVGGLIVSLVLVRGRFNPFYGAVFLWALAAIYAANGEISRMVAIGTGIAALLVVTTLVVGIGRGGMRYWLADR